MNNITFQSEQKDGIEFYVSDDGETTGMSINGLSRCCGVDRKTIKNILENGQGGSSVILKPECFTGNVFIDLRGGASENNARIVASNVCAELITYYAYKSKNHTNDIAKNTLDKFIKNGIDNWIKDAVGYVEETVPYKTLTTKDIADKLSIILQEIQIVREANDELRPLAVTYIKVKDGVRTQYPGLDEIIESIEDENTPKLLPGEKVTLSDWVRSKKINLTRGGYCAFGRMVSETYKTMRRDMPNKGNRKKSNGKWSMNVTLYGEEDFPILESALKQYSKKS